MVLAQLSSKVTALEADEKEPNDLSEELCERLRRNDPSLITMRCPSTSTGVSDANLLLLGQALPQNTNLLSLRLQCFKLTDGITTTAGVESLANGICQSKLKYLYIDGECPTELQEPLLKGIRSSRSLRVFTMNFTPVHMDALVDFLSFRQQPKKTRYYLTDFGLQQCELNEDQKWNLIVTIASHRTIKNLSLHACGLTDGDLEHFARHWDDDSPIQEFNLRGNLIGPRGAQFFTQEIQKHQKVRRLSYSGNLQIGFEGLLLMAPELEHCNLEGICLCYTVAVENNPTPVETRDEVCLALGKVLQRNHSLRYLIFAGNGIYPNGAQAFMRAIATRSHMAQLILIGNDQIGYDGLRKIGEELPHVRLEDLYLDSCVDMVTKSSSTETRLQACQALANGLRQNNTLKELDLANNGLNSAGAHLLIEGIAHHPSLVKFSIANNPDIGFQGILLVAQGLPLLRVEEINLRGCAKRIDTDVASNESKALIVKASQALIASVKENVYLLELNLEDMDLADGCREEINFYLELNNSGRNLIHKSDTIAPAVWCHIFANAEEDGHIYYFLREQPWLVRPTGVAQKRKLGFEDDYDSDD